MTAEVWVVSWPDGRTYWDSERAAEWEAGEMVKSRRAEFAVVFRMQVETTTTGGKVA